MQCTALKIASPKRTDKKRSILYKQDYELDGSIFHFENAKHVIHKDKEKIFF